MDTALFSVLQDISQPLTTAIIPFALLVLLLAPPALPLPPFVQPAQPTTILDMILPLVKVHVLAGSIIKLDRHFVGPVACTVPPVILQQTTVSLAQLWEAQDTILMEQLVQSPVPMELMGKQAT